MLLGFHWGLMENQLEKKMENEMDTKKWLYRACILAMKMTGGLGFKA